MSHFKPLLPRIPYLTTPPSYSICFHYLFKKPYMEILGIEHEQTSIVSSTFCSSETNDVDCLRTFHAHSKPWDTAVV